VTGMHRAPAPGTTEPTSEQEWLDQACELAAKNVADGGGPFGALVVRDGVLVASGVNQVTPTLDPTAHAEVVAIREACRALRSFQLTGCEVFASCEPCPMCLAAIYWARADRLYFAATKADAAAAGFEDSFIYEEIARPLAERRLPARQLLHDAATQPFEEWARAGSRVLY